MALTVKALIALAQKEVGYLEKASNAQLDSHTANAGRGNWTKYARDLFKAGYYNGNKNGYAWCDVFVDWLFYKLCGNDKSKAEEMTFQTGKYGASCMWSAKYYRAASRFHTTPKIGDQIFFGERDKETHTGIVYAVNDTYVFTIEGNTSGASGVVANGGGVCRKQYNRNHNKIVGYGRPNYEVETKSKIAENGKWGEATTKRLQEIFGTTADGIVSNQWKKYKAINPGLRSGWDWDEKPNGKGSSLIKAMQKWAGMSASEQDGEIGTKTIKALQKKLGTPVDGKISNPSAMVKALQKWANAQ